MARKDECNRDRTKTIKTSNSVVNFPIRLVIYGRQYSISTISHVDNKHYYSRHSDQSKNRYCYTIDFLRE